MQVTPELHTTTLNKRTIQINIFPISQWNRTSPFAFWPGVMINLQWLDLPIFGTKFHGPKDLRAIEVWLYLSYLTAPRKPLLKSEKLAKKSTVNFRIYTFIISRSHVKLFCQVKKWPTQASVFSPVSIKEKVNLGVWMTNIKQELSEDNAAHWKGLIGEENNL